LYEIWTNHNRTIFRVVQTIQSLYIHEVKGKIFPRRKKYTERPSAYSPASILPLEGTLMHPNYTTSKCWFLMTLLELIEKVSTVPKVWRIILTLRGWHMGKRWLLIAFSVCYGGFHSSGHLAKCERKMSGGEIPMPDFMLHGEPSNSLSQVFQRMDLNPLYDYWFRFLYSCARETSSRPDTDWRDYPSNRRICPNRKGWMHFWTVRPSLWELGDYALKNQFRRFVNRPLFWSFCQFANYCHNGD
jgi:hypothetical protein